MTDYLRRLAPARETNVPRAVAVLPSRFSHLHPLQGIDDQARSESIGNDEPSLWRQPSLPSDANPMAAAQRPAAAAIPPAQATPIPQAGKPRQSENVQAMSPVAVPPKASGAPEAPLFSAVQGRAGGNAGRARSASSQATSPAAAVLPAMPAFQEASVAPTPAQDAWPLSDASLAQRMPRPQDDGPVVHVTIGRIEVVAQTAPTPVATRGPAPRQPSVTLADYLRGSHGGRP
jgi:hypothetical protein